MTDCYRPPILERASERASGCSPSYRTRTLFKASPVSAKSEIFIRALIVRGSLVIAKLDGTVCRLLSDGGLVQHPI